MTVDLAALVSDARTAAEDLMVDACTITEAGAGYTYDPNTMIVTPDAGSAVYSGKCKVQIESPSTTDVDAGVVERGVQSWRVDLPVAGTEAVKRKDVVTITASVYDAALVGRSFTVEGPHAKSFASARRLIVSAEVDS